MSQDSLDIDDGPPVSSSKQDCEKSIRQALASLQLPHMPVESASASTDCQEFPSITVLVCADIDLKSSSALAEYTLALQQTNNMFDANQIDLVIVAGPCVRDEDLLPYCQGKQLRTNMMRNHHRNKQQQQQQQHRGGGGSCNVNATNDSTSGHYDATSNSNVDTVVTSSCSRNDAMIPFLRSPEEASALEGLMTASLSQLESIVCRVVYCPGFADPLTTTTIPTKRLTPNSRNIHQQWMPLVPGLGIAGLFYLDGTEKLLSHYDVANAYQERQPENDDDSEASDEEDSMATLAEQLRKLQKHASLGYCSTLSKLLQLAPSTPTRQHPAAAALLPVNNGESESAAGRSSILVTHYVDGQALLQLNDDSLFQDDDDDDDGGDFDDCFYDGTGAEEATKSRHHDDETSSKGENADFLPGSSAASSSNNSGVMPPWPVAEHDAFLDSPTAQNHLLLEIASGSAVNHAPAYINHGSSSSSHPKSTKAPVLLPGSLRERGEFSLLEFGLVRNDTDGSFSWQVKSVEFHHLNNFG